MKLIYRIFAQIILVFSTDAKIDIGDRSRYLIESVVHVFPFAIIFKASNIWFQDNKTFAAFLFWALIGNTVIGILRHLKTRSFNWADFFGKNSIVIGGVLIVYIFLEMFLIILGDLPAIQYFETIIQAMTIMYPTSKIMKNVYILTNRKYPPRWLMNRIYNFEKTGDLEKFFNDEN